MHDDELARRYRETGGLGPLMIPQPKPEYRYPWKNTDTALSFLIFWLSVILLVCSPAIVVSVYRGLM